MIELFAYFFRESLVLSRPKIISFGETLLRGQNVNVLDLVLTAQ